MSQLIDENGVRVQFPDNNYFQFSTCQNYINIKSQKVKETDVGWFDISNNILWLVELKAFDNPNNPRYRPQNLHDQDIMAKWIDELVTKSIHAVCMACSNRVGTQTCLPQLPNHQTRINIVHLVKVVPNQSSYLSFMQDAIRAELMAYKAIFNIAGILVLDYDSARQQNLFPWIV
ncbi:hypothetical protein [Flectobacillus sp. BAB-3569]|uniref:hypothetical protein n=1 Tax=Flectobacillus sp. BAB-3569 TaxID=1509483 RepID=UPI000BA30231|nr:hypothetical protein [Flectobacillus sp. BAB-3569]PAC33423.1 hypothetical protein BWI92_02620 [Flectobacillus sp. BAB-3569]